MVMHHLKRLIPEQHPARLLWHKSKAYAAAVQYGFPAKKLTVIGVTGTDGKTTTVGMIAHILNANKIPTGALTTAFFQVKHQITWNATQKTSPDPFVIQKFLRELVDTGCTHVVLEYSSHGLIQGRTLFTYPAVAGITNMSEEHLDYHKTMEEYIRAKGLLFEMLPPDGTKVLHYSDRSYKPLVAAGMYKTNTLTYNEHVIDIDDKIGPPMDLWLEGMHMTDHGSTANLVWLHRSPFLQKNYPLTLSIPGAFNLSNALCAIGCVKSLPDPLPMESIVQSLADFHGIPGRMERIVAGQDFSVFIDFTVTPQSYEATLSTLKKIVPEGKRLLVLMGSCGDRMKEKRPVIGKIASNYADILVVTNEDPYTEDPEKIMEEVWAGVDQTKTDAHRISDRKEAIEFLLKEAKKDDIVILCGKGSDTTMWVKDGQIPWNEREITKEILQDIKKY
jgi:UDP-N-acetylmuramoyl-L-alanyl-D-glutamate--2,6-diaminopimelate ligase